MCGSWPTDLIIWVPCSCSGTNTAKVKCCIFHRLTLHVIICLRWHNALNFSSTLPKMVTNVVVWRVSSCVEKGLRLSITKREINHHRQSFWSSPIYSKVFTEIEAIRRRKFSTPMDAPGSQQVGVFEILWEKLLHFGIVTKWGVNCTKVTLSFEPSLQGTKAYVKSPVRKWHPHTPVQQVLKQAVNAERVTYSEFTEPYHLSSALQKSSSCVVF